MRFGARAILGLVTFASLGSHNWAAVTGESLTVGSDSALPLGARYFRPTGPGPFPAVLVLHGVGGLWKNDDPGGGVMSQHFEDWAQDLAAEGYASLFVDSYTARGIVEFDSRRPAEDPTLDDSICSPAYERPKDVFKALAFLQARTEVMPDRIGLLAFSQGAETALASLLSPSIARTTWTMSYLKLDGTTETRTFPPPQRLATGPGSSPGFSVAIVYYPGCGYFGYFGSPGATSDNLYMPYAPTLIQHGGADPLYAASLYPEKFVLKSAAQASTRGLTFNPLQIAVYPNATHSFDEAVLGVDPELDTPNQFARRHAHEVTLRWLETFLKPPRINIRRQDDGSIQILWSRGLGARYRIRSNQDVSLINEIFSEIPESSSVDPTYGYSVVPTESLQFFRLERPFIGTF